MVSHPSHWTHVFTKDTPGALDALQQGGVELEQSPTERVKQILVTDSNR